MSHSQGLTRSGYVSDPPLPKTRAVNHQRTEAEKARKDAEKQSHDRKRRRKEDHEKVNRAWEKKGLSPLPSPESTPEPDDDSSGSDDIDLSMFDDPDTEVAGDQPAASSRLVLRSQRRRRARGCPWRRR